MKANNKRNVAFLFLGFVFLNIIYFVMNYAATGTWHLLDYYVKLIILMNFIWFMIAHWEKKYEFARYKTFWQGLYVLGKSTLFMVYLTSLFIVLLGLTGFSRLHVLGTFSLLFVFECLLLWGVHARLGLSVSGNVKKVKEHFVIDFSISLALLDYVLFLLAIYLVNYFKYRDLVLEGKGLQIFLIGNSCFD